MSHTAPKPTPHAGQALMEFVMVLPVLLIILYGAFAFGGAFFSATQASSAIREPALQKLSLAQRGTATTPAELLAMVPNNTLDSVGILNANQVTAVLVGQRNYTAQPSLVPVELQFNVTQGINGNLLRANTIRVSRLQTLAALPTGLNTVPYSQSSTYPNGTVDPARYGVETATLPTTLELADGTCQPFASTVNANLLNNATVLNDPQNPVRITPTGSVVSFANTFTMTNFIAPPASAQSLAPAVTHQTTYSQSAFFHPALLMSLPNRVCDDAASQATFSATCGGDGDCERKARYGCRLQYNNEYGRALITRMTALNHCNGLHLDQTTAVNDTMTWPTNDTYTY